VGRDNYRHPDRKKAEVVKNLRKFKRERYIMAAIITIIIFSLGFVLGLVIEGKRADYISNLDREQKIDFSSLQLQFTYINQLAEEKNCEALVKSFDVNIENLDAARIKLESYDQNSKINKEEFQALQREYTISELNYWLFAEKTEKICSTEQSTILYFFSDKEKCPDCDAQAFILTYLKKRFKEKLLVFSLDERIKEPIIEILKKTYNINIYPTLIINDKKFEGGITSKDTIIQEICKNYNPDLEECKS
jgi:hypothetical protein